MIIGHTGPFNLSSTLSSGQAFRWREESGWFQGVLAGSVVRLRAAPGGLEVQGGPDDEPTLTHALRDYLCLDLDVESVYEAMSVDDRLRASIARYRGMRVLRQDPWECLVSFICSSASNIPRITKNVNSICEAYGRPIEWNGHRAHAFPSPAELAECAPAALRALGLGYRAEYVASTARAIAAGEVDLLALRHAPYETTLQALTSLDGVGDKVANCVMLCSLDKPTAFPVDTWIDKAIHEWYLDGKKLNRKNMRLWAMSYFGQYAGYANHYLFHDRRLRGAKKPTPHAVSPSLDGKGLG